jgi:hypothetical protein
MSKISLELKELAIRAKDPIVGEALSKLSKLMEDFNPKWSWRQELPKRDNCQHCGHIHLPICDPDEVMEKIIKWRNGSLYLKALMK